MYNGFNNFVKRHVIWIMVVVVLAAIFRFYGIGRGWVYDEIWGFKNWIGSSNWVILSILNAPNNHPLNSIFMKYAVELFGLNPIAVRFHSVVAGILLVPTVYFLAIIWLRNRYVAVLASILTATHGGLVYFSQVARGYSLETFLIVLFALLSMIWFYNSRKLPPLARWGVAIGLTLSMIIGCITLCTAILFIVPIMLYHLYLMVAEYFSGQERLLKKFNRLVRENIELLVSWTIITAFAVFLYFGNYDQFTGAVPAAGGMVVDSFDSLILFLKNIFAGLMPGWLFLPLLFVPFNHEYRKAVILIAGLCFFAFSTVLFAKGGPVRAYLPLVPFFCVGIACGFQVLLVVVKQRYQRFAGNAILIILSVSGIAGLAAGIEKWGEPDSKADFRAISKIPTDYMVVYAASYSMPMAFNNRPEIYRDNFNRISSCRDGGRILLLRNEKNHISVLNNRQGEASVPLNVPGRAVTYHRLDFQEYELRRLQADDDAGNRAILATVPLNNTRVVNAAMNYLRSRFDGNWLPLNCWLYESVSRGTEHYSAVALVIPPQPTPPVAEFVEIEQRSAGKIRFFQIDSVRGASY